MKTLSSVPAPSLRPSARLGLIALSALGASCASSPAAALPPAPTEVRLTVDAQGVSTAPVAGNVCPDTPLRLDFASEPALGTSGKIQIFDAATNAVVESINVSSPTATKTIGGLPNFKYYPVIIVGREADVYPHNGILGYGHSYYVTIDPGVFQLGGAAYAGISLPTAWRFRTKAAPPAAGTPRLTVAADGTGDFATVQGALDFIPDGNRTPTTIFVRKGTYTELVYFTNKHSITLVGEDRKETVIAYSNNERFNNPGVNPYARRPRPAEAAAGGTPAAKAPASGGPPVARTGNIYHRGVFMGNQVDDLTIANLTIRDTTPQGGSQAEAIILGNPRTPVVRAILKDVDLYSYQDTLQINGQAYLQDCFIEGDVDFMWGSGPCFFEDCTCHALRSGAYYTQIRNPPTNHGYVYLDCTFDGATGIMGNYLSRIGSSLYPHSEVVLVNCLLTSSVGPVAWLLQNGPNAGPTPPSATPDLHFWEYGSHDAKGRPVNVSRRLANSRQLKQPDDAAIIADYRDPTYVLGGGWKPKSAPIFALAPAAPAPVAGAPVVVVAPESQLALLGTSPAFAVVATGAGPLHYQWSRNGTALAGATSDHLRISRLQWPDAGNYTVTVGNAAGAVTSPAAELTAVVPDETSAAPRLPVIPETVYAVTAYGAVADGKTDDTLAIQKAIDTAVAAGGGIVTFPAAPEAYLSGPITLGDRIDLEVEHGAILRMLPYGSWPAARPSAYHVKGGDRYPDLITVANAHDVALTGGGRIDGQGAAWWRAFAAQRDMPSRPFMVQLYKCDGVLISGLTLTNPPMFHVAADADNLTVFGLTVSTPESPNTDGVDPAGEHQLIQNCSIADGDDNIAVKAGNAFCGDLTVADCEFGYGHGLSVGGQSNRGLDGMTVRNCYFHDGDCGLRLKADATQGGLVQNVSYTNLVMEHVAYPIVFYSYYNRTGHPGAVSGKLFMTPDKVRAWNAAPPNSLKSKTLPAWKNITLTNFTATGATGYSTIWGLPLAGCYFDTIKLNDVHIAGGAGFEIYNASNVQFGEDVEVGKVVTCNALAITDQPRSRSVAPGADATFTVGTAGTSGEKGTAPAFQWSCNGSPLKDGPTADGAIVSGAATATLALGNVQSGEAGKYTVVVSNTLDANDPGTKAVIPNQAPVSATSGAATLTVAAQ